ncbi:hypothetical protein BRADI_3g42925v3 [Brachypodium distachyon]|uniref:Uncharacterized protein n=1 Tax=Brachypodium distachyon TaxID=15368 RepID=I1I9H9_BRADI|nr:hypothetical protein BRADI_3g42925v3 [Brachypodium distachyon]
MARMDPRAERVVRRTAMVGAVTAAYLLLTADYGPNYPNPVKKVMESSALPFKDLMFRSGQDARLKEEHEDSESPDGTTK